MDGMLCTAYINGIYYDGILENGEYCSTDSRNWGEFYQIFRCHGMTHQIYRNEGIISYHKHVAFEMNLEKAKIAERNKEFKLGREVIHPSYGKGKIVEIRYGEEYYVKYVEGSWKGHTLRTSTRDMKLISPPSKFGVQENDKEDAITNKEIISEQKPNSIGSEINNEKNKVGDKKGFIDDVSFSDIIEIYNNFCANLRRKAEMDNEF